ncbi:MAG: response regulator [Labilithrix sp.]
MVKPALETLRAIFREEFDDMLALLRQQIERALEDPSGAADELRRAVHTLKGASRAAGYPELEAECHKLETRAETLRASGALTSDEVASSARDAVTTVTKFAPIVHAATAVASPPSIAFRAEPGDEPSPAAASSVPAETLRVDTASLGRLLESSEDLVLEMARGLGRSKQSLELATTDLVRELELIRSLAAALEVRTGSPAAIELRRRLERSVGAARTIAAGTEARSTSEAEAWRASSERAKLVASAARSLRQERFESLATSATQAAEDAAERRGVKLTVVREGDDVRFDRRLREPLREVLLHLVRNAVAHGFAGLRGGTLRIRAEEGEGELRVIVSDDGRGIDRTAVAARATELGLEGDPFEVLFAHGFSTQSATDELAGRGVGLDVVRQRVTELHGRIRVTSELGKGTTFLVSVSPDLSLTRALVATAAGHAIAIRLSSIERIVRTPRADVQLAGGRAHLLQNGVLLPLANVGGELGARTSSLPDTESFTSILTGVGERRVALIVDEITDEREVAVRPLAGRVRRIPFVSGTTLLPDGTVAWMLDVQAIAAVARGALPAEEVVRARPKRVLVVDDSATTRELERTLLRVNGFDVETAVDGEAAWLSLGSQSSDSPFDIVLTDVEMPRLDGFGLLGRIRATPRYARLPVVMVTALEDPADKQRALDMGASAYIVKSSFDEDQLLDVIAHLL